MKRILVVEVNWLGDCVMTLPVFSAIKKEFPASFLAVMVAGGMKDLFNANPFIDEVITFSEKDTHRGFISRIKFIGRLRRKNFDTVFFIHRSFTRMLLCFFAGIPRRIGYRRRKTSFLLSQTVEPPRGGSLHRSGVYFRIFEAAGIKIGDTLPRFTLDERESKAAAGLISRYKKSKRYLVVINPSSNWIMKRWPQDNFVELINQLDDLDCLFLLIGATKDETISSAVAKKVNQEVVNLCGRTSLNELAAILGQADLVISSDSGPAHLAAAVGAPVLVLFGPTDAAITAPRGEKVFVIKGDSGCNIPCYKLACDDSRCMKKITPPVVAREVRRIVNQDG
ncbi:MAG: lipopolysaccharide heptosyltransferase II [Candidatus Omnitrophota bacterium]